MRIDLRHGDCLDRLKEVEADSIELVVSDPPYELAFMGRGWDATGIAYNPELWGLLYKAVVPGGVVKVFGATRTFHRMCQAMEKAGFDLRPEDSLEAWAYGQGMPKGTNISKALAKNPDTSDLAERWEGWNTALKPAWEPIVVGHKPSVL